MKTTLGEFRARTKELPDDVEVCVVGTSGTPVPCDLELRVDKPEQPILLFTNYVIHE